ncbi:hypothetical protein [Ferrimonas sp. YFM]|uniref:hypothetical protein n=1 Tax=Ferrimonas sp. YFM TaxID=3028878 RepID=UPI0025733A05|nr:hypothetical protein [Ferrimonas sp. YFM]BDY05262.1 hypothetical protein F0521_23030 [Ferrimonas sp. YFM]
MSFIEHTHAWVRGEGVDMAVLCGVGLLLLLVAGGLWRFVATPLGQALVIPISLIALLFLGVGVFGVVSTPAKLAQFSAAFELDPSGFVQSEQERVAGFEALYLYTLIGAAIGFALALGIFWQTQSVTWRAIGIALVVLGLAALVIDGFSKERATVYQAEIDKALSSPAADRSQQ